MKFQVIVLIALVGVFWFTETKAEEEEPLPPSLFLFADAGTNQNISEGNIVYLNGLGSFGPSLSPLSYEWSQVSGSTVNIIGANSALASFVAPSVMQDGENLVIQLIVMDGTSVSEPSFVTIHVYNINQAPFANAGAGQSVQQQTLVTLDGSASFDADLNPLTYTWSQISGPIVSLDLSNPIQPKFLAPIVTTSGVRLTFRLVVSDGVLQSNQAYVDVLINNPNQVPIAHAGSAQNVFERSMVTLDGSASSDPDGSTLTYMWSQVFGPSVVLSQANSKFPTFQSPEVTPDGTQLRFQLVVSDGILNSEPDFVNIQIVDVNRAPLASAGLNQSVNERTLVALSGSSSTDPDGDSLSYQWSQVSGQAVTLSNESVANPTFTAPEVLLAGATLGFQLTVSDGILNSTSLIVLITVRNVNRVPVALAGDDQTVNMAATVTLHSTGSFDPDGDEITYIWAQISGPAVVLNKTNPAFPTFKAPNVPVGGATLTFSLATKDASLTSSPSVVNVLVKNVNSVPVPSAGFGQTVAAGTLVTLDGSASYDPDDDAISFLWTQIAGPSVLIANSTTDAPSFEAPAVSATGATLTFKLTVKDATTSASATVNVIVERVNHPPIAIAGAPQTVQSGVIVSLDGSQSFDPDGDPLTFSWIQISGPEVVLDLSNPMQPKFLAPPVTSLQSVVLALTVIDVQLSSAPNNVIISVMPKEIPPPCHLARAEEPILWPPNHKMIPFNIVGVFDASNVIGSSIQILTVTQDEPTNGLGDGDTAKDAVIKDGVLSVRSERQGIGNGRVYKISFKATKATGGTCTGFVYVQVPKNANSNGSTDSGQNYNSFN